MWYPADPYENYEAEDYLNDLMGWSQRIREHLTENPLSLRLDHLEGIGPLLSTYHYFAQIGQQMSQQEDAVTLESFLDALGDGFLDKAQDAQCTALCQAPESFLDNFSLNDSVHLLELLEEATHFVGEREEPVYQFQGKTCKETDPDFYTISADWMVIGTIERSNWDNNAFFAVTDLDGSYGHITDRESRAKARGTSAREVFKEFVRWYNARQ